MKKSLKINVYYQSSPHLDAEKVDDLLLQFIQKRLKHFFPEAMLQYMKTEEASRNASKSDGEVAVFISLLNPLLDISLFTKMVEAADQTGHRVEARGAVPGTTPLSVRRADVADTTSVKYVYSDLQRRYNSQLNLGRLRRVKLFTALLKKMPDLHRMSVEEVLDFFSGREGTNFVVAYGEDVKLEILKTCPLCTSESFTPLHADVCQPLTGFLTRDSEYYFRCEECGLVFANPRMPETELYRYYDKYSYDAEWNPESLKAHYDHLDHLNTSHYYNYTAVLPYLKQLPKGAVAADLGGGEGEFVVYLRQNFPKFQIDLWDYRVSPMFESELKTRRIGTKQINFLNEDLGNNSLDLVSNWEVIEHLPVEKLEVYFRKIYAALKPGGMYIFSTPDFESPYCQALDFWAITPGEHLSVLSRKVLEPVLTRAGFKIIGEHHECVSLKTKDRWYLYGAEASSSMAARGEAAIINDVLRNEAVLSDHLDFLRKNNLGSELILCCQKA